MRDHQLILAHFSEAELASLDLLQGGPSFDDKLGIREYSALAPLFDDQSYLKILEDSFKQIAENNGDINPAINKIKNYLGDDQLEFIDAPGDNDPEILALSIKGENEDSKLALVPKNVADTLSIYLGYKINSETGLREFFFLPLLAAIGSGLASAGGALAGGLGAIGSGVASMLAPAAIGSSAATAFGAGGLGSLLGSGGLMGMATRFAAPYLLSKAMGANHGTASKMAFYNGVLPGLANMADGVFGKMGLGNNLIGNTLENMGMGESAYNAAQNLENLATPKQQNIKPYNPYGALSKNLLQMSMVQDFARRDKERRDQQRNEYNRSLSNLNPLKDLDISGIKLENYSEQPKPLFENYNPYKFKKGGSIKDSYLIDGKDDGQKDNRSHRLKEGDFIINATVVSGLGSGNTKAGTSALNQFFKTVGKYKDGQKVRSVPALLSDGEYKVDRDRVTALGKGSNDKGVQLLTKLQKNVLHHSASKKGKLPPAAKKIQDYF